MLGSCAHGLKLDGDLAPAPDDLKQKIEQLTPAEMSDPAFPQSVPADVPLTPAATKAPVAKSKRTKKTKALETKKAASAKAVAAPPTVAIPTWAPAGWPFGVGEKIVWALRYGLIEGGVATLTVEEPQVLDGEPVLHYHGDVKSSRVLELFYKIDNQIDTWVRMKDHLPMRQEIKQNESARWGRRIVIFDQNRSKAKFFLKLTNRDGGKDEDLREDDVAPYAQEIFGAMYFFRFTDTSQKDINFPVHDRWKNWNNELKYVADERIHVPAGDFDSIHFKVYPRVTGNLATKGDVDIWVWKNPSNLVLKFTAKIKVGSITGEVRSYTPGKALPFPPPVMHTPTNLTATGEIPTAAH